MKKLLIIFLMLFALIPVVSAQLAVQSFEVTPEKVLPGNQVLLRLRVENGGKEDIENILVKLDLNELPFAPLRSSTEKAIGELKDGEEVLLFFDLAVLSNTEPQIYKIPVKISYNNIETISLISIEVTAKPELDVILDDSELVKINDNGKVAIKFINSGLTQIKSLTVTLQKSPAYEILSPNIVYIGEVDIDDFESEEFIIIPKVKNPQLAFNLFYKDSNNNEFSETKFVNLNIYTEEEAKELGLVERNIFSSIIIPVIIVLIAIFIYRRIRRKRKNVS